MGRRGLDMTEGLNSLTPIVFGLPRVLAREFSSSHFFLPVAVLRGTRHREHRPELAA